MNLVTKDPNFSVVVPGGCNSRCAFCYWKRTKQINATAFTKRLEKVIWQLPNEFKTATLTGGEPTMNTNLAIYAKILKERFSKVVLNTNGRDLFVYMNETNLIDFIDYINLSRHHANDYFNREIFGTGTHPNPNQTEIEEISFEAARYGVPITLNCVLRAPPYAYTRKFLEDYLVFARQVGAFDVIFRKEIGTLVMHQMEADHFSMYDPLSSSSCPVCVSRTYIHAGMKVTFKTSVPEPSDSLDGVYEAILHPNGKLTSDWAGKSPIILDDTPDIDEVIAQVRSGISPEEPKETKKKKKTLTANSCSISSC